MSENAEGTPRTPAAHSEYLGAIGVRKQIEHPRIQDWVQRSHLVNERQVLELSWFEKDSGEGEEGLGHTLARE